MIMRLTTKPPLSPQSDMSHVSFKPSLLGSVHTYVEVTDLAPQPGFPHPRLQVRRIPFLNFFSEVLVIVLKKRVQLFATSNFLKKNVPPVIGPGFSPPT